MSALSNGISWDATAALRCSEAAVCTDRGSHNLCRPCWSTRPAGTNIICHNMTTHIRAMPGLAFRGVRSKTRIYFHSPRIFRKQFFSRSPPMPGKQALVTHMPIELIIFNDVI